MNIIGEFYNDPLGPTSKRWHTNTMLNRVGCSAGSVKIFMNEITNDHLALIPQATRCGQFAFYAPSVRCLSYPNSVIIYEVFLFAVLFSYISCTILMYAVHRGIFEGIFTHILLKIRMT